MVIRVQRAGAHGSLCVGVEGMLIFAGKGVNPFSTYQLVENNVQLLLLLGILRANSNVCV